jgi:hypothetical protein
MKGGKNKNIVVVVAGVACKKILDNFFEKVIEFFYLLTPVWLLSCRGFLFINN